MMRSRPATRQLFFCRRGGSRAHSVAKEGAVVFLRVRPAENGGFHTEVDHLPASSLLLFFLLSPSFVPSPCSLPSSAGDHGHHGRARQWQSSSVPRGPVGAGRSSSLVAPAGLSHTAGRSNTCGIPSRGRALHAASGVRRASPPVPSSVVRPGFLPLFGPRDPSSIGNSRDKTEWPYATKYCSRQFGWRSDCPVFVEATDYTMISMA